jgi:multiple sugar transport system permease protein
MKALRWIFISAYLVVAAVPLVWLVITSIKYDPDVTSEKVKWIPSPSTPVNDKTVTFPPTVSKSYALLNDKEYAQTEFPLLHYFTNSLIIAFVSTLASVALGTSCAYGFSRFKIAGDKDWLFFILSTRFLPPLAVVVPIYVMYVKLGLTDTHLGLIILYTVFNLSLAVWLMKGFIDEIPKAYEEAALVDGYSWMQAFWKIIVPQAATGMAVTAVFCLISAWNEFGFALILNNSQDAMTAPVIFKYFLGRTTGIPWALLAAGALLYAVPIVVFTVLVRKHILRGMTFGTIKQ